MDALRRGVSAYPAAAVVSEADTGVLDLVVAGAPAQLAVQLGNLGASRGGDRVATREQPAAGVHRQLSAEFRYPLPDQPAALAARSQLQRLVADQLRGRGRIVQLDHVHVARRDAAMNFET